MSDLVMPERQEVVYSKPWRWEEDGMVVTRTTVWSAPGCHEGCGVFVYTDKDGNFIKLEGDPENPFNRGRLCPRCFCVNEVMKHPDRILYPMKRDKSQRGNPDAWKRVSWDEALDICYERLKAVRDTYGGDTIHFQRGTGRDVQWQVGRLAYAVGSPNEYGCMSGTSCYLPRFSQMAMTTGGQLLADMSAFLANRYDDPEYEIPHCVILWGCDPLNSNPDFQLGHWLTDLMQRGTKLITVDPRCTWLAAHSEIHLALRPGTDGALAMGLLNVVIQEDLYDHDFVAKWTYGFEELARRVADWSPEKVAEICWIDAEDIICAARLFAETKPASVFWGVAVDMQNSGTGAAQGILALWTICGDVDIPGGMLFTQMPFGITQNMAGSWGMTDLLDEEILQKRCGVDKYPMYRFGLMHASPDEALIAAEKGRCHAIWIQSSNTLTGMADEVARWKKVFDGLDFCAVCDLFMTPTAQYAADIFLPVKCWPEKKSFRAYYYDVSTINPCVKAPGEVKSDAEIDFLLGKRFSDKCWPWNNVDEIFDELVAPTGMSWEELRENGPVYPKFTYRKYEKGMMREDGQSGFATPTGRIELYSTLFNQFGLDPMVNFHEPGSGPVTTPEDYLEYPIILMTGSRSPVFFHTEHRMIERLRQFNSDPELQLSPATAQKYGINDGEWVWVENRRGRCRQRAKITTMVRDGMALGQHGWWYPEKKSGEAEYYDCFNVNINLLLKNAPSPTGFGADIKCVLCKVYPVKEGEM